MVTSAIFYNPPIIFKMLVKFSEFLAQPIVVRMLMCILALYVLRLVFKPVIEENKLEWAWFSGFLPSRDLKLVGQKGKYTDASLAEW